jgi:hypothetical protein
MRAPELEVIETELREGRPEPTPAFSAELDAWAAEGFPRREAAPAPARRRPPLRRWLAPALGFGVTAAIVIGVAVQTTTDPDTLDDPPSPQDQPSAVSPSREPAGPSNEALKQFDRGSRDAAAPLPGGGATGTIAPGPTAPAGDGSVQEKTASMTLAAEPDEVPDVAQEATEVTSRFGGVVDSMSVRTDDADRATARLQLRIPVQNLEAALAELSDLAHVESRDESLLNITKQYSSSSKRFNNAQDRVAELVAALAAADDPATIAELRQQLQEARHRLRAIRAELRDVKQRGNNSRVALTVVSEEGGWSLGDAADDAVGVLEAIGGALLIALAVIVPLGALAALLWLLSGGLRRRWHERVLDE